MEKMQESINLGPEGSGGAGSGRGDLEGEHM